MAEPDPVHSGLNVLPNITLDDVRRALALPAFDSMSAQLRMAPKPRPIRRQNVPNQPRQAAVLILLYPVDGVLTFPLMRRPEYEGVHSGQISLPGGSREGNETFEQNALRETREEFGVTDPIEMLGALTPIYVPPSDFEIHPFVGYLPSRPTMTPDPIEVVEIIEAPLTLLFDEEAKGQDRRPRDDGGTWVFPFYRAGEYKVWGATAAMLSELETRLRIIFDGR
jgi:8-oxo-dGTP pyrophosphatase MutT (NUDIX family)